MNAQRGRYKKKSLEQARIESLETIHGWSWNPDDDAWESSYSRLFQLASGSNGLRRDEPSPEELEQIRGWKGRQRSQYFNNNLDPEKIRRIELIPNWEWNPAESRWKLFYDALAEFAQTNDHSRPPRSLIFQDMELGEWVKARRVEFNAGKLSTARIQELETLPGWTWDPFEDAWQTFFKKIQLEISLNNNVFPKSFSDKKISSWITRQRKLFSSNQLAEARIKILNELEGWTWDYQEVKRSSWDKMYESLCEYVREQGHARVRDKSVFRGVKLGTWVAVQRRRYVEGTIFSNQRKMLETLPRWSWNPIEDDWWETYQEILHFLEKNGHIRPSKLKPDESE